MTVLSTRVVAGSDEFAANAAGHAELEQRLGCLLYTSPSPRDRG